MTLRLALVISGDASGARQALDETKRGVEDLGKAAETTDGAGRGAAGAFKWLSDEEEKARLGLKETTDAANGAAGGLGALDQGGRNAARGLGEVVKTAEDGSKRLDTLRSVLAGAAGGLLAGAAIGLATEGFKLLVGAASEYAQEILSSGPMIERALDGQAKLIERIKGAYKEAEGAASSYGLVSTAQLRFEAQENRRKMAEAYDASLGDLQGEGFLNPTVLRRGSGGQDFLGPFREQINAFRDDLAAGGADVTEFRRKVAEIAEALPAESPYRKLAASILEDTQEAAKLEGELERASDLLKALAGDADAAATALGGKADKYTQLRDAAPPATEAITAAGGAIRDTGADATSTNVQLAETERLLRAIAGLPSPARAAVSAPAPPAAPQGFAAGGFTGEGDPSAPAGIVHRGEFVFDAAATKRIGIDNLDAMRRGSLPGYQSGGSVASGAYGSVSGTGGGAGQGWFSEGISSIRQALQALAQTIITGEGSISEALMGVAAGLASRLVDRGFSLFEEVLNEALTGPKSPVAGAAASLLSPAAAPSMAATMTVSAGTVIVNGGVGGLAGGLAGGFMPNMTFTDFLGYGGGGSGGGFLSSIFKFITGIFGFEAGGYTGAGNPADAAGVVHRGEYVFDAPATASIGVPVLEALRQSTRRGGAMPPPVGAMPGYRQGGYVGDGGLGQMGGAGDVRVVVNDHVGVRTETRTSRGPDGETMIELALRRVGERIADGSYDDALGGRYGARPMVVGS